MKRIYILLISLLVTVPLAFAGASFKGIDKSGRGYVLHFANGDIPVLPGQITATNTNDSACAGCVGEYLSNPPNTNLGFSGTVNNTSGTWFSCDSGNLSFNDTNETGVTLTAGDWDVQGQALVIGATSTTVSSWMIALGTGKGTSTTGIDDANRNRMDVTLSAPARAVLQTPVYRYSVASGATIQVFLKCNVTFAVSTLKMNHYLRARRVR